MKRRGGKREPGREESEGGDRRFPPLGVSFSLFLFFLKRRTGREGNRKSRSEGDKKKRRGKSEQRGEERRVDGRKRKEDQRRGWKRRRREKAGEQGVATHQGKRGAERHEAGRAERHEDDNITRSTRPQREE